MTIYYLGEIAEGRQANNDKGVRSYSKQFRLKTTSKTEDEYDVGSHASLPIIGDTHPTDSGAWCDTLAVACTDGWTGWVVTATFTSLRELATDPTADPAIVTLDTEQFQKPAVIDTSGDAIANSAGDPYDPPNMMDDSRRIFTVQKNMATVPSWVITSQDAVNNDVFSLGGLSIAIGKAKVQRVSVGEPQSRNGVAFVVCTIQIHVQKDGWILAPLDAGFREIDGTNRKNIRNDGDDELPAAPVPLDGSGAFLPNPTLATCVYGNHQVYATMAFAGLPLT